MLDRCPTCGKTTGTLMETHPDRPGLMQILSGESTEAHRIIVTIALCVDRHPGDRRHRGSVLR